MYRVIQNATTKQYKFEPYRFSSDLVNYLYDHLPPRSTEIKVDYRHTEIQIIQKYRKNKIRQIVIEGLQAKGFDVFAPVKSKPYDLMIIKDEIFTSMYIDDGFIDDHGIHDVYIHLGYENSNIIFEDWYKRYMKSKEN